jgi:ABC-2 type transport system ATP-binding protein
MRQRLGIAGAMLGDPPVLMLDEPFNGLDPDGIIWMREFLRSLAGQGRAILVSSHLISEVENMADQLIVVGRGRVLADAGVGELIAAVAAGQATGRRASLEDAYLRLTRDAVEFRAAP